MTLVAVCSCKGAPGVTTTACLLAATWPAGRPALLAECDPSGGDVAVRFGLSTRVGMASYVVAQRHGRSPVDEHLQQLTGGLAVLAGPLGSDAAGAVDAELAGAAGALADEQRDVVADCGRLSPKAPGQRSVLQHAEDVLIVADGAVASLGHVRAGAEQLRSVAAGRLWLVVRGRDHKRAAEAAAVADVPLLALVPDDPAAAAVACGAAGSGRSFSRSALVRAVAALQRSLPASAPRPGADTAVATASGNSDGSGAVTGGGSGAAMAAGGFDQPGDAAAPGAGADADSMVEPESVA